MSNVKATPRTCSFKQCVHGKEILETDETVSEGKRTYHTDCYKMSRGIAKVKDFYYENVSNTVVVAQLVRILQDIIVTKKGDPDYLIFAIKRRLESGKEIKSPMYLHYLLDDNKLKREWKAEQSGEKLPDLARVNQICTLYQRRIGSEEKEYLIKKVVSDLVGEFGEEYVLFVLNQSIKENIPYKSIYTLRWLLNNSTDMKKKYQESKAEKEARKSAFDTAKANQKKAMAYKKNDRTSSWEQTLFGG